MKLKYNITKRITLLAFVFVCSHNISFAHFGSKGPNGGSVTCAIKDSTNAVYIGTADGGVFESTNSTLVSWRARPVGLKSGKITALAYTGSYLFTATADSGIYIFNGYVGSDRYWQPVNMGLTSLQITSLIAIDSITVLAGTTNSGIFKTTNKGATWTSVGALSNMSIMAFSKAGGRLFHTSAGGIFASDNNGSTWFSFNDMNTNGMVASAISYNDTTNELLVETDMGLFRAGSANSTMSPSYTAVQTGLPSGAVTRSIDNDGYTWYIATDHGAYTSSSTTINWISKNNGLTSLDATAIVSFGINLVLGINDDGIYQTATSSPTWVKNNVGFNNLETFSMATSGVAVIAVATAKGVFVSTDLATNYSRANVGLTDSLHVNDLAFLGTQLFAATNSAGVFVSADTGRTWAAFNSGITNMQVKKVIASSSAIYTFNAAGEVFASDGTAAWTAIQTGLPNGVQPSSLAFWGTKMLLGTLGDGVYVKTQSGGSWTASNTGLTNMNVTSVAAADGKLYVGTQGNGVFVSNAATISWTAAAPLSIAHTVTMGLDGSNVEAMASYNGYVFASYRGGLLATADSGSTWIAAGNQFNLPSYTAVNKISVVTTRVFVTTEFNSLYSNALSELPLNSGVAVIANATCNASCDGSATAMSIGGTSPYVYSWSTGSTNATASNLCMGTYTVTITDANLATTIKTVSITEPMAIVATPTSVVSTTGADGSASVTVSGGTSPYTYAWSNGGTNSSITGVGAENYTVVITDGAGCTLTQMVAVTGVTGIKELSDLNGVFSFYPNPSDGNFVIGLNSSKAEIKSISIYNTIGKLMQTINNTSSAQTINVSVNYPAGVYYVKVNTANGVATHKIIIQ
jgi:hypothetical protein